ncbi:MAG TPA: hypothetical protein VMW24_08455 [Sedimentisphaerales bacterium]|nr:hypothetical protein [Sedimentisphaerales bacterium]
MLYEQRMTRNARVTIGLKLVMCAASFALWMSRVGLCVEEAIFERKMSDEDAMYFVIESHEENTSFRTIEEIKAAYKHIIGSQWTVRVVAIREDADQFIRIRITTREVKPAATIYHRELTEDELKRYPLTRTVGPSLPYDMTLEEVEAGYGKDYWDYEWGVQKVEVLFNGALKGDYGKGPRLRVFRLSICPIKTEAEKKQDEEWIKMAKEKLAVGKDAAGFGMMDSKCKVVAHWQDARGDGPIPYGLVEERFHAPRGGEVITSIDQWADDSVPEHELLRSVMNLQATAGYAPFKVKKMAPGHVLTSGDIVIYPSGNCVVYLQSNAACSPSQMAKLYADKLPSTLQKDIDLDITKWYREEVEQILGRLKDLAPLDKPTPLDLFNWNLNELIYTVRLPGFNVDDGAKARPAKKLELYGKAAAWWQENKDKAVWNKELRKLAVPE